MSLVSQAADDLRRKIAPNSLCLHRFTAQSDFEAFQRNHDWNGWGAWKPDPQLTERTFTPDEVAQQQAYLRKRQAI